MDDSVCCLLRILIVLLSYTVVIGGPEGLRSLTNPKAVIRDRFWINTSIPKVLDYPVRSLHYSW